MDVIDSKGFTDWLAKRDLTKTHCLPYYATWVERFLKSPAGSLNVSDADRMLSFEDLLARDQHRKPWQRQQAAHAVKLNLHGFCKEQGEQKTDGDGEKTES